jgi:hypothetical protein
VVLLTLNPRPIVDLFKRVALVIESGNQIVIRKISIQGFPSWEETSPKEDSHER